MKNQNRGFFSNGCHFEVSLRYELFFSMHALLDPSSRIHPNWRRVTRGSLGSEFEKELTKLSGAWEIWPALAATLPGSLSHPDFDQIIESMSKIPILDFQRKILRGLLQSEAAVALLQTAQVPLKAAILKVPKAKREWLGHVGLYPYDPNSAQIFALERLLQDPLRFRDTVLNLLQIYWLKSFRATWERLLPQLWRSVEAHERLFYSCSFAEFSKEALLRIKVNEGKGEIHAVRGGYRLRSKDIRACFFLPSAFNDRRFWSAFKGVGRKTTVYFPYFDPSITLEVPIAKETSTLVESRLNPALIFKALGDATRFAIATLLARTPMTSVDLAKRLSVSKPTISHHVHLLREAGLIQETIVKGAVELRLKRSVLEQLSDLTVGKLFNTDQPMRLSRTRGGIV